MLAMPAVAVVGGDDRVAAISAASIVAKVIRDREMDRAAAHHPNYGFERHKGYATAAHLEAIERFGPTSVASTQLRADPRSRSANHPQS